MTTRCLECGSVTRDSAAELQSGKFCPVIACTRCGWYCRSALNPTVSVEFQGLRNGVIIDDRRPLAAVSA